MSDEKRWAWWFVDGESMNKSSGRMEGVVVSYTKEAMP
jgi:hypothetical protein